jgi:hypothetical protein
MSESLTASAEALHWLHNAMQLQGFHLKAFNIGTWQHVDVTMIVHLMHQLLMILSH